MRFCLDFMAWLMAAVSLAGASSCTVDHRHLGLELAEGSAAGADAHPIGNGEGGAADSSAGGAGTGITATDLVDGCADLDTDGVADCTVTLVKNPSFESDVKSWSAPDDTTLSWDAKNALSDALSGSAKLESEAVRGSVSQCVVFKGAQFAIAYGNAFVSAPPQGNEPPQAELEVSFFDSKDCSGERSGYFDTPPSAAVDQWLIVQAGGVSPATTGSLSVALVGLKPTGTAALEIYFDNVMLKPKPL